MKFGKILLVATLLTGSAFAAEFLTYDRLAKKLKEEAKKTGNYATTAEVKTALTQADWAVVDVRTAEEWAAGYIKGTQRVGREAPEKALESIVTDDAGKFIKDKLVVVCNSASRAAIEAEAFRKMGFTTVKIYDMHQWMDECNPLITKYSAALHKEGTNKKFGDYYAEHCKK